MTVAREMILGIDIGTSACKCQLLGADGKVYAESSAVYHPVSARPGWSEQDPEDWFRAVIRALASLTGPEKTLLRKTAAVGVTGQMRGIVLLGADGLPVRNAVLWNDSRCAAEAEELERDHGALLRAITHNPLNTMCSLPKLRWLMNNEPASWERTVRLAYPKDYIAYRLTGETGTDHSDASGSSFYDIRERTWSGKIMGLFGIDGGKLPPLRQSTDIAGFVNAAASGETGIPAGIPVAAGGSDAVTELLAAGIASSTRCKVRMGTSGALSTVVDRIDGKPGRYYLWSSVEPGRWMVDINTRSCAASVQWLREVFYGDESGKNVYDRIDAEAGTIAPGAGGLVFHPYLMGEDAPFWDPALTGSFWGVRSLHGRAHFARAVYEGTAFALRHAREALGPIAGGFREFVFVGGGAQSPVWRSVVADVLGIDAVVVEGTGSAMGAAMLGGVAAGIFKDLEEARERSRGETLFVRHDASCSREYDRLYTRYKDIKKAYVRVYSLKS